MEDLNELMKTRAGIYRMFSSLYFTELTGEQVEAFSQMDFAALEGTDPLLEEGARDIARALRRVDTTTREDLAVDYAHCFLAAGTTKNERRACPYESVFTSEAGLLMQDARDQVYKMMLAEHLEPDEDLHVPEDHLSFEFEFMADLCDRVAETVEAGDLTEARRLLGVQGEFHEKHQLNWIDAFCDALEACCRTDFYRGVAKMTRGFVSYETMLIEDASALLSALAA